MLINKGIATNSDFFIPKPSYSLTYIFNILACCCNNQIAILSLFKFFEQFLRDKTNCLRSRYPIMRINLSIMDTPNSIFDKVFFLKPISAHKCSNIPQLPILHPVRAEPLNHIAYLTHKSICSYKKL